MGTKYAILLGIDTYYSNTNGAYPVVPNSYAYVSALSTKLDSAGWVVSAINQQLATKTNIKSMLSQKINGLKADDWLLFFFTGHGQTYNNGTFLVSVAPTDNYNFAQANANDFFNNSDYGTLINAFIEKASNGQLITMLDCCFALGLVDDYQDQASYHTILASSLAYNEAFYTDYSMFFNFLSTIWDNPLSAIGSQLSDPGNTTPDACGIQIATDFTTNTL